MSSEAIGSLPKRRGSSVGRALSGAFVIVALLGAAAHAETPPAHPAHPDSPAAGTAGTPTAKGNTPSPADAYVYIGWPNNGEVINASRLPDGRFRVWFGLRNMGVAPAGVNVPNTGHHHLLIDVALPPLDQEIPSDKNHLHFGHGQTETVLELSPGRHTLQLLLADKDHFPHKPPVYSKVTAIIVK
jgi:Domain of unknown function (DUF4399)